MNYKFIDCQNSTVFQNLKCQIYGSYCSAFLFEPLVGQPNRCFQIEKVIAENYNPSEEEWKAQCSANKESKILKYIKIIIQNIFYHSWTYIYFQISAYVIVTRIIFTIAFLVAFGCFVCGLIAYSNRERREWYRILGDWFKIFDILRDEMFQDETVSNELIFNTILIFNNQINWFLVFVP